MSSRILYHFTRSPYSRRARLALAFKELRETRGIAAAALACYLVLVGSLLDLKASSE